MLGNPNIELYQVRELIPTWYHLAAFSVQKAKSMDAVQPRACVFGKDIILLS